MKVDIKEIKADAIMNLHSSILAEIYDAMMASKKLNEEILAAAGDRRTPEGIPKVRSLGFQQANVATRLGALAREVLPVV